MCTTVCGSKCLENTGRVEEKKFHILKASDSTFFSIGFRVKPIAISTSLVDFTEKHITVSCVRTNILLTEIEMLRNVRSFVDFFTTLGPANIDDLHTSATSLKGSYYSIGGWPFAIRGNDGFDHYLTRRFADNLFLFALPSS